jgi:hypothetical protein
MTDSPIEDPDLIVPGAASVRSVPGVHMPAIFDGLDWDGCIALAIDRLQRNRETTQDRLSNIELAIMLLLAKAGGIAP